MTNQPRPTPFGFQGQDGFFGFPFAGTGQTGAFGFSNATFADYGRENGFARIENASSSAINNNHIGESAGLTFGGFRFQNVALNNIDNDRYNIDVGFGRFENKSIPSFTQYHSIQNIDGHGLLNGTFKTHDGIVVGQGEETENASNGDFDSRAIAPNTRDQENDQLLSTNIKVKAEVKSEKNE